MSGNFIPPRPGDPSFLDLDALRRRFDAAPREVPLRAMGLREVRSGVGALEGLGEVVERLLAPAGRRHVGLLSDGRPKQRGGDEAFGLARRLLAGFDVREAVLGDGEGRIHADHATVAAAVHGTAGTSCLVTLGSGTVVDIGKVAAARHGIPHVVVQSATSVNGFADDQSVLLIDGVKRTTPSAWPDTLIVDSELIAAAPVVLNLAGIGDLAAMFTAPADWRLAADLGMSDHYAAAAVDVVREQGSLVLAAAPGLAGADPAAIELVARALTLSGISMGVAGTTAPSSGMEHTVSHLIEMAVNRRGQDAALHGAQVGVSTVVAAVLWHRVLDTIATRRIELRLPGGVKMAARVRAAFAGVDPSGKMGEECWRLYSRKLARWSSARDSARRVDWDSLVARARALLIEPAALCGALAAGGAPVRFSDLDPPADPATVRWALLNCHLMRDRFSVADLAFLMGMWEEPDVDAVLDEAAALGGGL